MARNKGTFSYAANYEVKMQAALDPRVVVEKKSDLIAKDTWPYDGDTIYLYKGLLVAVEQEQSVYMLVDVSKVLSTDYSGWLRVDAGNAEQVEVVDNLTSDATNKALSAKQGKTLKGLVDGKADLENGKIKLSQLPDVVMGQVLFGGVITSVDVSLLAAVTPSNNFKTKYNLSGTTISVSIADASTYEGVYFIIHGTLENETVLGIEKVSAGDWILSTGGSWAKIDNTDAVASVAGLMGAITASDLAEKLSEDGITNELAKKSETVSDVVAKADQTVISVTKDTTDTRKVIVAPGISLINAIADASTAKNNAAQALGLSQQNETNIANINLILNGNNNPDDDIPDSKGLITRLEEVETLTGTPGSDYDKGTFLSRLDALEELVTGGENDGEGDGDQTLLQKVNQNKLDITALESTVYGNATDNTVGLTTKVTTLMGADTVEGSVDYKIKQAFAWVDVS